MTMQEVIRASAVTLRDATPDDARALAELIAIAGAGIPEWLWSEMVAQGEGVFRRRREAGAT
jgi:hypothetical protein